MYCSQRVEDPRFPTAEAALARLFDPAARTVWRDQTTNSWERYKARLRVLFILCLVGYSST